MNRCTMENLTYSDSAVNETLQWCSVEQQERFLNKSWILIERQIIYILFSSKLWTFKFVMLESSQKNFTFSQTRNYNTKLHDPNKRKKGLTCFEETWLLNGMKMPWYCACLFLFFCLGLTVATDTWMRTTSTLSW